MSGQSTVIELQGRCSLSCSPCDCISKNAALDVDTRLSGGGARLVLRGGTDQSSALLPTIRRAREAGFLSVVVRTSAMRAKEPTWVAELVSAGAHGVIVPFFSHISRVHDAIAGVNGALVDQLIGMRALSEAGLDIEVEVPILSTRVQSLEEIVNLVRRAVPTIRRVSFRRVAWKLPEGIAPDPWDIAGPALARGVDACRSFNILAELNERDGVPPCAFATRPDLLSVFRFDRRRKVRLPRSRTRPPSTCSDCKAKRHCGGISLEDFRRQGERGLRAFSIRPRELHGQARRQNVWTEQRRAAASRAEFLVVRPTVNCNQDCVFCSANETSKNVWSAPDAMYRQIARAAGRGVSHISFSGGEPTLSPELVGYCKAAKRLGIRKIELVTNGVLLNDARVRALVDAGLTDAYVSLHAHDEPLSRLTTLKVGDFERTARAIEAFAEAGVITEINHVISTLNYRYLPDFVQFCHDRFGARVGLNFTFITPQFRALENIDLMPRLSEVAPYLDRALGRALELGLRFNIGSRQGFPPCFLGRFRGWSDVFHVTNVARSEDSSQKRQGPACSECRYRNHCLGLRHPYIERYGFDELVPVRGPLLTDDDGHVVFPILSFDELSEALRDREAEARANALPPLPKTPTRLAVLPAARRSRPLRIALFGSGRRARLFARALQESTQLSLEAVCSPRISLDPSADFGGCPTFREPLAVLDGQRPEAVIIASNTETHLELARLALERNIPCLIEKPLAPTVAEAESLWEASEAYGTLAMPAHNVLFAAGLLDSLSERAQEVTFIRRCPRSAPDAPQAWSADAILQTVYHSLVLVGFALGGGRAEVTGVSFAATGRPTKMRFSLLYGGGRGEVDFDFDATVDELSIRTIDSVRNERIWRRSGADVFAGPIESPKPIERRRGEIQALLNAFRVAVVEGEPPAITVKDGVDVLHNAREVVTRLRADGAPLARPNAPKHVASRELKRIV